LAEVPPSLCERLSPYKELKVDEVELFSEQHGVRESVKRNLYNGRTYNSLDNIAQFFSERGMPVPSGIARAQQAQPRTATPGGLQSPPAATPPVPQTLPGTKPAAGITPPRTGVKPRAGGLRAGSTINHPKYGRGTILRREGDGEDAKLTISFPGFGLKKIVEKYAGIKVEE
jgi:DNA helicase-2/ATP-dependent DNA helicase PcrA